MQKIIKGTALTLSILLLTACGASMVKKPAAVKIHSVAIATVVSAQSLINSKDNKPYRGISQLYTLPLTNNSPKLINSALAKIKGWKVKNSDSYIQSQAYLDFSSNVNEIWRSTGRPYQVTTAYDGAMPVTPYGIVLFAGKKKAATKKEYIKLCKSLKVDAVAIMTINYQYDFKKRLFGSSTIIPMIKVGIKVINKHGDEAVYHLGMTTTGSNELKVTSSMIREFTFDENPVAAYTATLKTALDDMVNKINKEL